MIYRIFLKNDIGRAKRICPIAVKPSTIAYCIATPNSPNVYFFIQEADKMTAVSSCIKIEANVSGISCAATQRRSIYPAQR